MAGWLCVDDVSGYPPPVIIYMTINFGTPLVSKVSEIDLTATSGPYGTHDALRNGFCSVSHTLAPKHALQKSLASIEQIEEDRKMYVATGGLGTHIPLRLGLEKAISRAVSSTGRVEGSFILIINPSIHLLPLLPLILL